jgi:LysM repeat protein
MCLEAICKHTAVSMDDLHFLNPALHTNVIPPGMGYVLKLPADKLADFSAKSDTIIAESRNAAYYPYVENYNARQRNVAYHYVRRGEGLYNIARQYGVTVYQLKAWNGLRKNYIYPGQRLAIYSYQSSAAAVAAASPKKNTLTPAIAASKPSNTVATANKRVVYYKIRPGDNLSSISHRYKGATVASIKAENGLTSNVMHPGQVIKITVTP